MGNYLFLMIQCVSPASSQERKDFSEYKLTHLKKRYVYLKLVRVSSVLLACLVSCVFSILFKFELNLKLGFRILQI